jgi:hypothetical protein
LGVFGMILLEVVVEPSRWREGDLGFKALGVPSLGSLVEA